MQNTITFVLIVGRPTDELLGDVILRVFVPDAVSNVFGLVTDGEFLQRIIAKTGRLCTRNLSI